MAYVSQIKLPNNSTYDVKDAAAHYYATCSTAAATAQKEITISNFILETGTKITITFSYGNSADTPSLSINSGTAANFYCNAGNIYLWGDNDTIECIYDGTNWRVINFNKIEVIRL